MSLILATPLPKGTEYLADVCDIVGTETGISPYLLLGICYAESNFGLALKPQGPSGSGDFIPRPCNPDRDKRLAAAPLPGVERRLLPSGIPSRKITGPCEAWVPTTTGWGCGLFQIDYEAHYDFAKSGNWSDPTKACFYAANVLRSSRASLERLLPKLKGLDLDRATIASYNAGAGRVAKTLREGKTLDDATFHRGYVQKICDRANLLAGKPNAFAWASR